MSFKLPVYGAVAVMLACVFRCADVWAICSISLSGTTASVTCNDAADSLTISQDYGQWIHTGPLIGDSSYDWNTSSPGTQYLAAGGTIQLHFPSGGQLHIGNGLTPASGLKGSVSISNPASSGTQVFFDSAASTTAAMYTIDDAFGVSGVGQLLFDDSASAGLKLTVTTGTAGDVVNVRSVCACNTLELQGTSGSDTVNFGRNGSTQWIAGAVTVLNNAGVSTISLDDHADTTARSIEVMNAGISGIAPAAIYWNVVDTGDIVLTTGSANDTVVVSSLGMPAGPTTLTINGTGTDAVILRGDTNNVQDIEAPIVIANSGGLTELEVVDTSDPLPRSARLSASKLSGLFPGTVTWGVINIPTIVVRFGSAGSVVHVLGTPPQTQAMSIHVNLFLNDGHNRCYVAGSGLGAGSVLSVTGGNADDLFVASAVPIGSALYFDGGPQIVGDKLVYTSGPATGAVPGSGALDPVDPNAAPIYYNSIERFSINDWIFSDGFE